MAERAPQRPAADMSFPVVGIGASAGGLEAIGELLTALPVDTGMAFIVVQHLDPVRPSLLAEILAKKTAMPVAEVRNGSSIAADRVYIIAPGTLLTLSGNALRSEARDGGHPPLPVDVFFNSLAAERGHNAIAVVLSGSGSDGARGVQAVKEAGGITLAQDEATAGFPAMPKNAIDTGCVDFVLAPAAIGEKLARIARHPYLQNGAPEEQSLQAADRSMEETAFKRAFRLMRAASGMDFTHYKRSTIERRIGRRMAVHHFEGLPAYVDFLQDNPSEVQALAQDMLIGVTSFFRDAAGLDRLKQTVFPALMEGRSARDTLRIWVPGCSSGEEAYSMAISVLEFLGPRPGATPIQIFGTDVSDAAIERARIGIYLPNILAEVSAERLARFFVKLDDHYQIAKSIREMCVFARHDITRDPPFSRLDLVSCCNVLIYMDQALQQQVLAVFHYALKPRGFLMLGPSESIGQSTPLFELTDQRGRRIYTRKAVPGQKPPPEMATVPLAGQHAARTAAPAMLESERMQREADRVLLNRYAPPCILIDDDLNVLQFRGQTTPYLEHAPGPASLNLRRLAAPGLIVALGPAMQEARRTDSPARTATVRLEKPDGVRHVSLSVNPFRLYDGELRGYLIAFEDALSGAAHKPRRSFWDALVQGARRDVPAKTADDESESTRLQRELAATREYLQAALEEHEAAKEELRSAHEEVLSSNEELQSTNEELETAKEELQSTNEELLTTNDELRNRNRELAALNEELEETRDYTDAIVETTRAPLLVLDGALRVVKANRAFCEKFEVRAADTEGRMIYDLGNRQWDIAALRTLLHEILPRDSAMENYEVRHAFPDIGEKIMLLNARRLPPGKNRPEMILLGIEDQTERVQAADILKNADRRKNEFLAMLAHELRNPLAPVRLSVDALRALHPDDVKMAPIVTVLDRQVMHLSRLVDDLLDVSRISRGTIMLHKHPVALDAVLDVALEIARPVIESRKHRLSVVPAPQPIHVEGDINRLAQIVANLLDNAAKYTETGGDITLSTHAEGDHVLVKVKDNGTGIPMDQLPRVFDLFYQADPSFARRYSGLGIGLALASRIAVLHGGTIEARSDGEGKGTEFTVRLPRLDANPAPVPAPAEAHRGPATPPRRILVVDDSADVARMTQMMLECHGHEVRVGRGRHGRGRDRAGIQAAARADRHRHAGHGRLRSRAPPARDAGRRRCRDRGGQRLFIGCEPRGTQGAGLRPLPREARCAERPAGHRRYAQMTACAEKDMIRDLMRGFREQ
ncbi:MAG: chemotaxis protein CheB [Betaproteobacteria bacterium]